jgi:hypothetical protein
MLGHESFQGKRTQINLQVSIYTTDRAGVSIMSNDRLVVVWSSGDPEVAHNMVFMYTTNAKKRGWFDDVVLIIWGPSSPLLARDESLQQGISEMMEAGVEVMACRKCAENYGIQEELLALGVDSIYIGETLSNFIKEGRHVLTF